MNIKALLKSLLLRRFTSALLLLQLALTLGLIVNSFILADETRERLLQPTGLPLENMLVVESLPNSKAYDDDDYYRSIIDEDLAKLAQLPGVNSVAPHIQLPIQTGGWNANMQDINAPADAPHDKHLDFVSMYYSTPDALAGFGGRIIDGRGLTWDDEIKDNDEGKPNIVISQSLANALYPDGNAVGQITNRGHVVGITSNFLNSPNLDPEKQFFYFVVGPITNPAFMQHYVLNVDADQMDAVRAKVSDVILGVQPERTIMDIYTMAERHTQFFERDTGLAGLFAMLCILMLIITAISSYAHAQFHITQQKKFIGIRRALGARRKDILIYVLSENWLMTIAGALVGVLFVVGFNMFLAQQISIGQPSVSLYLTAVCIVLAAGTIATWLPALKTSKIPPVIATRTV